MTGIPRFERSIGKCRSRRFPVAMMPSTRFSSMASTWSWPSRGSSSTVQRKTETPLSTSASEIPDITGKDLANPLASILSAAMLLRHSGGQEAAAALVERAVRQVLAAGCRTGDIMEPGATLLGTEAMGDAVAAAITSLKGQAA